MSGFFRKDSGDASMNFGLALGLAGAMRENRSSLNDRLDAVETRLNGSRAETLASHAEADAYKALVGAMVAEAGRPEEFRHFSAEGAESARAQLLADVHRMSAERRLAHMQEFNRSGAVPVQQSTIRRARELDEKTIAGYPLEVQKMKKAAHKKR